VGRDRGPPEASEASEPFDPAALREAAMRLLARREHSLRELADKLARKGWPNEAIDVALAALADEGLQSDARFAESFVRQRAEKGYGPVRIRAELRRRGIDDVEADRALEAQDIDFFELAASVYRRRYARQPEPQDIKERARRHQAMLRRGFTGDQLREIAALSR
jgi:regulatory protein